ncbi:MAG TPA: SCE4755 family polysaccharide monooxygenase-like protein [Terriglobia bacterium]|nr:SCE4755 family polysaccharide monooxygenase-like protein [Terriglobia bacterium]
MRSRILVLAPMVLALAVPFVDAHFKLLEPTSWIVEGANGDPQKAAPCGGTAQNAGTPSNVVNTLKGGQKLHLKVQETVYHPGHYRVALATTRAGLPPDPKATTRESARGLQSVSAEIEKNPKPPVLSDGLFVHTSRSTEMYFETDIEIPNFNCPKCVLQVIQFMAEHGLNREGDFSYHHCADVSITVDPSKPIDKNWPAPEKAAAR